MDGNFYITERCTLFINLQSKIQKMTAFVSDLVEMLKKTLRINIQNIQTRVVALNR